MSPLTQSLVELTRLFDRLGLAYALMRGLAVRVYGIPRATYDIDFTLAIRREYLEGLYQAVEGLGYTVPEAYASGWVDEVAGMPLVKFRLYVEDNGIDIDVFLAESPYQHEILARRRREEADGVAVYLVSPEDLILLKLIAGRPRDVADVHNVLFIQGQVDVAYMREWSERLGIADRLAEVLAGPPSI
ncbi:MAG TPA: nucleotidyl transferase AbiEii/AbiGii toxin family protein [Gemmataceae bacterium]|nr:nucleotidyl transferase AbiEii/AbiGii toxin family protein [Gemmataceae bacterium]